MSGFVNFTVETIYSKIPTSKFRTIRLRPLMSDKRNDQDIRVISSDHVICGASFQELNISINKSVKEIVDRLKQYSKIELDDLDIEELKLYMKRFVREVKNDPRLVDA